MRYPDNLYFPRIPNEEYNAEMAEEALRLAKEIVERVKSRIPWGINESISKDKFKQILRRFSKDINNFSFSAPMIANKRNDYVYF